MSLLGHEFNTTNPRLPKSIPTILHPTNPIQVKVFNFWEKSSWIITPLKAKI